jgi:hypothetical protein
VPPWGPTLSEKLLHEDASSAGTRLKSEQNVLALIFNHFLGVCQCTYCSSLSVSHLIDGIKNMPSHNLVTLLGKKVFFFAK